MAQKKSQTLIACLLSAGLIILFFDQVLLGERTFYFRDIHRWFYPMKYFLSTTLRQGEMPFWCSRYYCGAPFLSDIQSGVYYPLSLLFVAFPFPWSFNLYILSHFFLGFLFCYQFVLHAGRSRYAALFAATAFCYGGYIISSINTLNNLSTAIWLPAVLWRLQIAINGRDSTRNRLVTVFFLAMAILGGEPQLFIMIVGLGMLRALIAQNGPPLAERIKRGGIFSVLVLSAIVATIAQLGPTYLDYLQSTRYGGVPFDLASEHSLQIQALKQLVLPLRFPPDFETSMKILGWYFPGDGEIPWLLTIYPGFLIVPLAAAGIVMNASKDTVFWLAMFALATLLSLGAYTPLYALVYKLMPFFRFPEKFMFLAGFSLIAMAATGMDLLLERLRNRNINPGLVSCLLLLTLIADLYATHKHLNPTCEPDFYRASHTGLAPILEDPGTFRVYVDSNTATPDAAHKRLANFHARWQLLQMTNLGIISGIDHVDGITGMELRYQYLIYKLLTLPWPEKIGLLRIANVKYIISDKPLETVDVLRDRIEKLTPILYRLKGSLPRACLLGESALSHNFSVRDLAAGAIDPTRTVLAEDDIVARYNTPYYQDVDGIRYIGPGRIQIQVDAKRPALLFLSESFYPGWRVTVDGQRREPLRLNIFFQGIDISEGRHIVEFSYRTPYFALFSSISLLVILCMAILFIRQKSH